MSSRRFRNYAPMLTKIAQRHKGQVTYFQHQRPPTSTLARSSKAQGFSHLLQGPVTFSFPLDCPRPELM